MGRGVRGLVALAVVALVASAPPASANPATQDVSESSASVQGDRDSSLYESPALSADGRYVAFVSSASNLVAGDTNGIADVFVRDLVAGTTERVSVSSAGVQGNLDSGTGAPAISADGRFVAFASASSNLVADDTNHVRDVFVRDRTLGTTERVSLATGDVQANDASFLPAISADGRFVAFGSEATNLVANDTNGRVDVFVRDREMAKTGRVSVSASGKQANGTSDVGFAAAGISADGRFVVFLSFAPNLVPGDRDGVADVFVRDRALAKTGMVSVSSSGALANSGSWSPPAISADGRFVVFASGASNLVPGDTNNLSDIFIRDRAMATTRRVSVTSAGTQANGSSWAQPAVSGDGRFVSFESHATNLVAGDTNGVIDIFVRDRANATTTLVSVSSLGQPADGPSTLPAISTDGRFAAFGSDATNLVPGDTNGRHDVFVFGPLW